MKKINWVYQFVGIAFFIGGFLILPKISFATIVSSQTLNDVSVTGSNGYYQPIGSGLSSLGSVSFYETVNSGITPAFQLLDVTNGTSTASYVFGSSNYKLGIQATSTFTGLVTISLGNFPQSLNPTHSYAIVVFQWATIGSQYTSFKIFGSSSSVSNCWRDDGSHSLPNGLSNISQNCSPINNIYFSVDDGLTTSLQFIFPSSHHSSILDNTMQAGLDFSDWVLSISGIPATSTALYLNVNSPAGTDFIYLPASSTCSTCYNNITVPKQFSLFGSSTSTPNIYYAHAFLHYNNATGTVISDDYTYFGIFGPGSSYTLGNYWTPNGYQGLQSSTTNTSVGTCDRYSGVLLFPVQAFCDMLAWLFIPNGSEIQYGIQSMQEVFDNKIPFAYFTAMKAQIQSYDCIGIAGCAVNAPAIPGSSFTFAVSTTTGLQIVTPIMFSIANMSHFFGASLATFRSIAVAVMWLTIYSTIIVMIINF